MGSRGWVFGVAVLVVAVPVAAQSPRDQDATQVRNRQRISMMEAVLERAVANGADNLLRQVRAMMPDTPMLSGTPQVRGTRLEGYGVFFDVGVPLLRMPMMWPLRQIVSDNTAAATALEELRVVVTKMDPDERAPLEQIVRRLEMQLGPSSSRVLQRTNRGVTTLSAAPGDAAPQPAGREAADRDAVAGVLDDPNEAYTREVKAALVDAMLESTGLIDIGPDEWLTVAARDNLPRDPLIPTDIADSGTVILSMKGSDLAAFRAGRISLDEARARMEVREQ